MEENTAGEKDMFGLQLFRDALESLLKSLHGCLHLNGREKETRSYTDVCLPGLCFLQDT